VSVEPRSIVTSFGDPELVAPVLERLVSTAGAQADMSADRLIDMLTAVDALANGITRAGRAGKSCDVNVAVTPGHVTVRVECANSEHAAAVLRGAEIPGLGKLLERFADSVDVRTADGSPAGIDVRFASNERLDGREVDGRPMPHGVD
jgi:hypothetical protein